MGKSFFSLVCALILIPPVVFTSQAFASSYLMGTAANCSMFSEASLRELTNKIGIEKNLDLPKGQRISARVVCIEQPGHIPAGYAYAIRAAVEQSVQYGGKTRYMTLAEDTGVGFTEGDTPLFRTRLASTLRSAISQPR